MTIFYAIIALGVLIFVHELGHFIFAKKSGVGVEKFSLGFGPKIIGKKVGETEYLISAVPIGGYVKMVGEDPRDETAPDEKSFSAQSVWRRLLIVIAGPAFNIFFAIFLFIVVYSFTGVAVYTNRIGEIVPGYPAEKAGLKKGDIIKAVDSREISKWKEITKIIYKNPGRELKFTILRDSEEVVLFIKPRLETTKNVFQEKIEVGLIGIRPAKPIRRHNPFLVVYKSFQTSFEIIGLTVLAIVKLIQRVLPAETIGGPIFIFQLVDKQVKVGLLNPDLYIFLAFLSINLGILNLLPIPILDGGHILFFSLEAILGKPVSLKKREIAQQIGLFLLISLMALAFYNDILRIFGK